MKMKISFDAILSSSFYAGSQNNLNMSIFGGRLNKNVFFFNFDI
jgi:hypothetical protein